MNDDALQEALEININKPGRFKDADLATIYFYYCSLDGEGDRLELLDETVTVFNLEEDEREYFGLEEPYFALTERQHEPIDGQEITAEKYTELEDEAHEEPQEEYDE